MVQYIADEAHFKEVIERVPKVKKYLSRGGDKPVALHEDIGFLITHDPAWSYLDRDRGDKNLYMAIAAARPKYHIFGHVHEKGLK